MKINILQTIQVADALMWTLLVTFLKTGKRTVYAIVLKPGSAWRVDPGPGRPGTRTGPGWKKNKGRKNSVWPGWPGELTRQDPVVNPLTFVFFIKTTLFWFKKKLIQPTRWPGQNPKPEFWTGPTTGPGLKTMVYARHGQVSHKAQF